MTRIIIDREKGVGVETTTIQWKGPMEQYIREMVSEVWTQTPSVLPGLSISTKGNESLVYGRLSSIRILTTWHVTKDGEYPTYEDGEQMVREWKVPDSMKLIFLVRAMWDCSDWTTSAKQQILVAKSSTVPGWHMLPLSNAYESGELCMLKGATYSKTDPTLSGLFKQNIDHFQGASYNADLAYGWVCDNAKHLFKFKNGEQVFASDGWESYCKLTNHDLLNHITV